MVFVKKLRLFAAFLLMQKKVLGFCKKIQTFSMFYFNAYFYFNELFNVLMHFNVLKQKEAEFKY